MFKRRQGLSRLRMARQGHKRKGNRIFIIGGISLFCLLLLLFLIFFTHVFQKKEVLLKLDLSEGAEISASSSKNIYYLKGTSLYSIDGSGDILWTSKFSSDQLHVEAGKQVICLYNEQTATVLDTNKNPLFTIPPSDFTISEVVCGKNSVAFLSQIEGSTSKYIRIFSSDGTEIDRVEITNTTVLKFGFYGDTDNIWYLTLDTTGVEPISRVTTMAPSQKKITGLYEVYGQIVNEVCFSGSDIYISDTNSLTAYNTFGEKLSEWQVYGSKLVDSYAIKDDLLLAYAPTASIDGSIYTIRILSRKGMDLLVQLPSGIEYFALGEKYIYCFSENTVYLYSYTGAFEKSIPLNLTIDSFRKLSDNLILLGGEQGLCLFTLN